MKEKYKPHLYRMLSFLVPCCIMLAVFALNGKYPFGEDALLESDAAAQYYPFLLLLRRTVRSGGSLLYTWRAGLGTNFWALISYYCLSPWNLVALLLPESAMQLYLSLSVCVRMGLAGLTAAFLMQTLSQKQSPAIPVFASLYGLSQWMIWNYFQLIWLDAAVLMPLLLAGMVRMVRDRRCKLFTAVLLLSLICNPYFSFITCEMTFLCWICALIIWKKPLRTLPREAGRFFGCALLSGGMAAVILVPLAFAVRVTGASGQSMPDLLTFPDSIPALLGRMVSMTYPIQHIGMPNLSCSMLGVLLFAGFLTAKRIPLRERLTVAGLLLFLLLSLWYPPLNYIWHGFHVPNGFIHRFAFLVPFVLLMAGWRFTATLGESDGEPLRNRLLQLGIMLAAAGGICICGAVTEATDIILVSVLFLLVYGTLYLWQYLRPQHRKAVCGLLLCGISAETFISAQLQISFLTNFYLASQLQEQPEIAEAAAAIRSDSGSQPQRTASSMGHGFNPELFSDLPFGGTLYSSLIPGRLSDTLSALGMYSGADLNRYFYQPLPPVSALLTDIRYVIAPNGGDFPAPFYAPLGDTAAVKFQYDLPFGFCIPEPLTLLPEDSCPLRQNRLFRTAADRDACVILPAAVRSDDAVLEGDPNGTVQCKTGDNARNIVTYAFTADADGWYIYDILADESVSAALKRYDVKADGEVLLSQQYLPTEPYAHTGEMCSVGMLRKGQKLEIMLVLRPETAGTLCVQAARLDEAAFAAGLQEIGTSALSNVQVQDTEITGRITATAQKPLLYLPVPYDKGWHAEIDGQSAEITEAMPGMLGLKLSAGTHTIRLYYRPQGFAAGCIISIISILLCPVLLYRRSAKKDRSEDE
ncbi:MAG: YfhO family protein [Oscillospiraceae bacterium]|nr:YfhO family protein [Oscillospiraceae bacterium]